MKEKLKSVKVDSSLFILHSSFCESLALAPRNLINEHIDQVMEDAPTKLKVTVNVSDADWQRMQELHNQWMVQEKQNLADQHKQQEVLWRKQSHRLTDIVRNNEGVWLSQRLFYIVGSLSLLSIIMIVLEIAFYVYFHWIL